MKIKDNNHNTIMDRLSAAFILCIASFITFTLISAVLYFFSVKLTYGGDGYTEPFEYSLYISLFFAVYAFLAPDKAMALIALLWGKIGALFSKSINNDVN